ncbi:RICIN domain-containing protein [Catenovulum agarivorans]|uniref:RICIN domain-containing protein n=1 Tax=Catenovulum agarivorans TaxID=1172192 RepID=UPI00030EA9DC|nr:RICIN domain-containing protein [Catenovulum agarivorans]
MKYSNLAAGILLAIGAGSAFNAAALTNGTYVLKNAHSGKVMDVSGRSTADGANIIQYTQTNANNQLWDVTNVNGNYSIVSVYSKKALEVYNFDSADGANIVQWAYWGGPTQLWTLDALSNGNYGLINQHSGKAAEVYNFSTANSANIAQWTYWAGAPQQWTLEHATYANPTLASSQFTDVTVHDPSIFETTVNGQKTYYIFGSFAASAKSTDLMNWTLVSEGVNNNNPLFGYNLTNELAEGFAWTGDNTALWAADVVQLSTGEYAYYYNQSLMTEPRGYTGVATSWNVEGAYSNTGLILKSGMWGQESENAGEIYDPTIHPNAVDPHAFYDKDGKMWLVYGSYSGGIFILEANPATGKPYAGQGYGKHLLGGDHSHIEAAFIQYSPETGYYYLFSSFGGLASDGGYNVRVARATSPDGPYYDAQGNNMANVRGDRNSIAPYGMKLMGGFEFAGEYGYLAPGHQSTVYNSDTGQYFLVFHTRFPNSGEFHQVRVHEMFMNADGWPVVAPQRYAQLNGANKVDFYDMVGSFKFVNHEKDINTTAKQSVNIQLNPDGTVSGSQSGTWWIQSGNKFQITLNGLGTFNGVASWQYNAATSQLVPTFSALSSAGVSVWGTK